MSGIPAGAGSLLGKRLGKYEILALLALGGTAEIYLARIGGAAGFEKYVVVKCLHDHLADDSEFVKMFLDEARLAAHLDHSNIVQTMELGEHENRYYMVMEFLAGLSLAMVVRRAGERLQGGRIPIPLVLNILAQACAGLHYAHEKAMNGKALNIVHRDISPQNLVISFEGVVKVVDFGIAKAEMRETRTRSGTIKGKFAYMSPEQCVANNVDRRTDVFALGVIGHELLTGRRLFKKASPYETYQSVIECAIDPPSKQNVEVDPAIDPIIMRAVCKEKEDRYPTAEAFGDAILSYLHHRGKGSGPGEVARFFDTTFAQEIDEHAGRMRELISGRDLAAEAGVTWGEDDEEAKRNQTVDLGGKNDKVVSAVDLVESRPSAASLSDVIDDLGAGRSDDGEDDLPAERTRIETNPLEALDELNKVVVNKQKTPPPQLLATQISPANPPPAAAKMPPSGALPLPAPPPGPTAEKSVSPKVKSGRFPELANLPTMIADLDESPDDEPHLGAAKTELATAEAYIDPHGPTNLGMLAARPDLLAATMNGVQQPPRGNASTPMPQPQIQQPPMPQPPPGMHPQHLQPPPMQPPQSAANMGYPVMNAQLSAQIATGATVFPSAADVASPVGQHYGDGVDWAAAAAAPAKALPPWKLIVLFVGAIGLALLITIIIAKIAR
jgi:serine/threonine-protein kinase